MAGEPSSGLHSQTSTVRLGTRAKFRIHRATCPRCGHTVWFTLFSERTPEEVEWARKQQEARLLSESCERHREMVNAPV